MLKESKESQGGDPLGSQSESWKFKKDDSAKQTFFVILVTLNVCPELLNYELDFKVSTKPNQGQKYTESGTVLSPL